MGQKLMTPLDYIAILTGAPPPPNEPDVQYQPIPTPVWMPNPMTVDPMQVPGLGGGPTLPPPIAPPAPPQGFSGMGGMIAPEGGMFG
jgi:hypothetical protein